MKTVSHYLETLEQVNDVYLSLCDQYESVKLVRSPLYSEYGVYVWQVQ